MSGLVLALFSCCFGFWACLNYAAEGFDSRARTRQPWLLDDVRAASGLGLSRSNYVDDAFNIRRTAAAIIVRVSFFFARKDGLIPRCSLKAARF